MPRSLEAPYIMAFYPPFVAELKARPIICYPDDSIGKSWSESPCLELARLDIGQVLEHMTFVITEQSFVDVDYVLGFFWRSSIRPQELMTDLWIQRQLESYGPSAPQTHLTVWCAGRQVPNAAGIGNASGDTMIVVGREEEWRRKVMGAGGSLSYFIHGQRPPMPDGLIVPYPA